MGYLSYHLAAEENSKCVAKSLMSLKQQHSNLQERSHCSGTSPFGTVFDVKNIYILFIKNNIKEIYHILGTIVGHCLSKW